MHHVADSTNTVYGIESDDTLRDVRQKNGDKVPFSNPQFQETGGTGMDIVHELTVGYFPGEVGECLCVASDAGHSVCCHIVEGALSLFREVQIGDETFVRHILILCLLYRINSLPS